MLEHASTVDAMHLCYACLSGDVVALQKSLSSGSSVNGHILNACALLQENSLSVLYSASALPLSFPLFSLYPACSHLVYDVYGLYMRD